MRIVSVNHTADVINYRECPPRATVLPRYDDYGPAATPQSVTPLLPDVDRHEFTA